MNLKSNFILAMLSLVFYCVAVSQPYDNLRLSPSHPKPGQEIKIEYDHSSGLANNLLAFILFNRVNERWPRAEESTMTLEDGKLTTYVTPLAGDVSLMVIIVDSLGNVIDNNNDLGYWTALYNQSGEKIPGSLASIANIYFGVASAQVYKIKANRDLANKLYLDDFSIAPELKRFYFPGYLASIRYEKEPDRWLQELNEFASQRDLSEWDLLNISKRYESIKDTINSNKYLKLINILHPYGEYVLQNTSVQYQKRYFNCSDARERMKIYAEHKSRFSAWPMNEDKHRYLEVQDIMCFLRHIEDYITEGKLNEWKSNMDLLRERQRYIGYTEAAKRLSSKRIFLDIAQDLISKATVWREKTLFSPRTYIDWPYLSERDFILYREKQLTEWLNIYEHILRLQNKNEEAREVAEQNKRYTEHQSLKFKSRPPTILVDIEPPKITFTSKEQIELTLDQFKGKTVVLDFWATWCGPCIAGFKKMNELQNKFSKDSTVFLYVNTMEKGNATEIQRKATKVLDEFQYPFEVLYDIKNQSASAFDFTAIPTVVVIDKQGKIRFMSTGTDNENVLESVLKQLK